MSKYSVKQSGSVYWVINNRNGQSASNTYNDRSMAERVCDRLNLRDDLDRI